MVAMVIAVAVVVAVSTAVIARQGAFIVPVVVGVAHVAASIACFVSVKVVEGLFAALGHRSSVTAPGIIAAIDVAVESVPAMEPGAGSKKDSAIKPIGPVVAVGSAIVRGIVEVAIRANRGWSNVHAEGYLCRCPGCAAKKRKCESRESKEF